MWEITETVALSKKRERSRLRNTKRTSTKPKHCVSHAVTAKKPETPK